MEYTADERPALNGHGTGQLESLQHAAVPATLLPTVLNRRGPGDRPMPGKLSHPDVPLSPAFTSRRATQIAVMGERYQLQEPIGRGGMATIYRGRDLHKDRVVAVKVLREAYSTDVKSVARFRREAKAASSLRHPNIVQVYDYGQTEGKYYLVMELVEGTNLHSYLHARGVLDVDRSVIIAHDVALGLGAAHRRGIVHRDVKPQNILVGRDGSIKLTDFGIAWVQEDNAKRLTTTGMTLGTVHYYAPEQARGEIVSPAADVYALGIVLYEMLTGHVPFDGDNPVVVAMQHIQDAPIPPRQRNPSIPAALEEILLRCLEKVPEKRFRDGSQLARAFAMLGDAQLGESVPVVPAKAAMPATAPHLPSRPGTSGRDGALENVPPGSPASSPENGSGPGVPADRRDSRFASMITLRMLLAILFLLGCSAFLAVQPGFIPLPSFSAGGTPAHGLLEVPDLQQMRWSDARAHAEKAGFRLVSETGQTAGLVVGQNPKAHEKATKGSTLEVRMELLTTTMPPLPLDGRLAPVEAILRDAHR